LQAGVKKDPSRLFNTERFLFFVPPQLRDVLHRTPESFSPDPKKPRQTPKKPRKNPAPGGGFSPFRETPRGAGFSAPRKPTFFGKKPKKTGPGEKTRKKPEFLEGRPRFFRFFQRAF